MKRLLGIYHLSPQQGQVILAGGGQQEMARQIVQEAGADYLLTVKANQKELRQTLAEFAPSARRP